MRADAPTRVAVKTAGLQLCLTDGLVCGKGEHQAQQRQGAPHGGVRCGGPGLAGVDIVAEQAVEGAFPWSREKNELA